MKLFLSILLTCISIKLSAQTDTIFYFNKLNRVCEAPDADYQIAVKRTGNNSFSQKTQQIGKGLDREEGDEVIITLTSDSTFDINHKDGFTTSVLFHRCDSGFFITEPGYKTISKGFSKNLFPLVKSGIWEVYHKDTKQKLAENFYEQNEMIRNSNWNEDGSPYFSDVFTHVEVLPLYKNKDFSYFNMQVMKGVKYPQLAVEGGVMGKVYLQFVVLKDGSLDGVRVLRGAHPELDAEAMRALKSVKGKWTPGTIRNNPVNTFMVIPVIFRIQN